KLPRTLSRALAELPVSPTNGCCGAAVHRRKRVVVRDVRVDPLCDGLRSLLLSQGLHSCWSTPIHASDGVVLGTVSVYYRKKRVPGPREVALVERAIQLARIAIERRRIESQLEADREHFRSVIDHTSDIVSILNGNGIIRYMSPAVEPVLGFHPSELVGT